MLKALTGSHMPGKSLVIAEGNSLGRGPVIFHLSPSGIAMIRKHAAGMRTPDRFPAKPCTSLPIKTPPARLLICRQTCNGCSHEVKNQGHHGNIK